MLNADSSAPGSAPSIPKCVIPRVDARNQAADIFVRWRWAYFSVLGLVSWMSAGGVVTWRDDEDAHDPCRPSGDWEFRYRYFERV